MLEGLVGLAALAVVFWAIPVLGRYQDIALQAAHASRYAAFLMALGVSGQTDIATMTETSFFSGSGQRWLTPAGEALMPDLPRISTQRVPDAAGNQPGAGHATAALLRREWHVGDESILRATVLASPADVLRAGSPAARRLKIERSTSILTGAGYAVGDQEAQQRVELGSSGWQRAAAGSVSAGRQIASRLQAVDEAWGRPRPEFDWLHAWQGLVPADRLVRQP